MTISSSILVTFSIGLLLCLALQTKAQLFQLNTQDFGNFFSNNLTVSFDIAFPNTTKEETQIKRSNFPREFIFGVGTAAPQIEGAANEFGKGPSVWDYFAQKFPEKIANRSDLRVAVDHYKRYKSDVQLIKNLGVKYYRFSIAWTRILPKGSLSGGVNQQGIDHYNKLIDELIANGIKPFVTLLHFDIPQALQEKYGGPLNKAFVKDFKAYSELCFKTFGDRVKHWVTINEPFITAAMGYSLGVAAPGRCTIGPLKCPAGNSATEPYIVAHNLLLAHAAAFHAYRLNYREKQGGEIGICHVGQYAEPYDENSPEDEAAAERALDFNLGWFMEPLMHGEYPKSMVKLVKDRLPKFTEQEKRLLTMSYDFIGVNYYTSRYYKNVKYNPHAPVHYMGDSLAEELVEKNGVPIGPKAEGTTFLYIYPEGLQKILNFMNRKYNHPKFYITENGITEGNKDNLEQALSDTHRITSIRKHLQMIESAIKEGVDVKGYFHWALFDDFEWADGYGSRFGLYYIDYKDNLRRIPKLSASWYRSFLKQCN